MTSYIWVQYQVLTQSQTPDLGQAAQLIGKDIRELIDHGELIHTNLVGCRFAGDERFCCVLQFLPVL
jgi:hypothetical protein